MIYSSSKLKKLTSSIANRDIKTLNTHEFGALFVYERVKDEYCSMFNRPEFKSKLAQVFMKFSVYYRACNNITKENAIMTHFDAFHIQKIPYYQRNNFILHHFMRLRPESLVFMSEELKTEEIMIAAVKSSCNAFWYIPDHLLTPEIIIALTFSALDVRVIPDSELLETSLESWRKGTIYISDQWLKHEMTRKFIIRCYPPGSFE